MADPPPPPPPQATAAPAATKARIIKHMNREHERELSHYLRAYAGATAWQARNPQLLDVRPDALVVKCAAGTHTISLLAVGPPLSPSLADARARMVDLARDAESRLGLSGLRVRTYLGPRGAGLVSFLGVTLYFFCAATLGLVQPGTAAWALLGEFPPSPFALFGGGGAPAYRWLVKAILAPVLVIHVTEAWWMATTRLERHGVDRGGALWLAWVATTFLEGIPAIMRFDALVVEAEQARAKEKAGPAEH